MASSVTSQVTQKQPIKDTTVNDVTTPDTAADNNVGHKRVKKMSSDNETSDDGAEKGEVTAGGKEEDHEEQHTEDDEEEEEEYNEDGEGPEDDEELLEAERFADELGHAISHTWHAPDGGWGWVVVFSAWVASLIVDGVTYTFGIFLGELEREFQAPKSTIALASSLQIGMYLMVGPIVSALTNRFGCRPIIIVGSLVASAAFMISSYSPNIVVLILTYGVIGGIGFGMMYLPAIVSVSIYFESRRAIATGIAVSGSGIGTFALAPLTEVLLNSYNWSWTLMILGAIILNGAVVGLLVRPLDMNFSADSRSRNDLTGRHLSECLEESISVNNVSEKKDTVVYANENGKVSSPLLKPPKFMKKKKPPPAKPAWENIPLITITDDKENTTVLFAEPPKAAATLSPPKKDNPLLFSSTPNIGANDKIQPQHKISSPTALKLNNNSTSDRAINHITKRHRAHSSHLVDVLNRKTDASSYNKLNMADQPSHHHLQPQARGQTPMGLSYISLTDVHMHKIRDEMHMSLSRRELNLASSVPGHEWDSVHYKGGKSSLYVHSIPSIAPSKHSAYDVNVAEFGKKRSGLWRCLPESAQDTLDEMLNLGILKDNRYWYVLMGNFFCMIGFYVPFVYIPERAKLMGISEEGAAWLVSIIGIANTVSRILTGLLINFINVDTLLVNNIALFTSGVVTILCPFCTNYAGLVIVSVIFGISVAAYISLCSILLCELLGVQNLTNAFGFVILFRGVACVLGPPIAGALIDNLGVFDPAFFLGGGFIVLGALSHMCLHLPCTNRHWKNKS